jgi:hypothetical protein
VATESVEIIDIESGMIESSTGENKTLVNLKEKRAMHTTIALNDGSVLFIGGVQGFSAISQEEAFEDFPILPYSQLNAVKTIERYMPPYPKYNMKTNGYGTPIANYTENIPADIPFMAFQSIHAERISDTQTDVFLVGGVDEAGVPSNKAYKFTITETDGDVSVSDATELAESSTPMILPALAYSNGSLIAAGGRPVDSEHAASVISESGSEDFGSPDDNIFFMQSIAVNGNLYTFGGYEINSKTKSFITNKYKLDENGDEMLDNDGNPINETRLNNNRKWDIAGKSVTTAEHKLRSNSTNVIFPAAIYDNTNKDKKKFLVIGGTDVSNLYQVINADSLVPYDKPTTHIMDDNRIMPSAVIIPAGVIGENPIIVITGGTSALNSTGSLANSIKINIL